MERVNTEEHREEAPRWTGSTGGFPGDAQACWSLRSHCRAMRKATQWPPKKTFVPGLRRKDKGLEMCVVAADPSTLRTQLILHAPICLWALSQSVRGRGSCWGVKSTGRPQRRPCWRGYLFRAAVPKGTRVESFYLSFYWLLRESNTSLFRNTNKLQWSINRVHLII